MQNKIKILHMFGEPISYGGEEAVVYNLISALGFNGFSFDLFTPYHVENNNIIKLMNENNSNIYSLNLPAKINDNRFLLEKDINNFLEKHHDYDIIHIHSGSLATMCVYSKTAKKYNIKKVICHSHSSGEKESIKHKIQKHILNFLLQKNCDYYLSCSENAAKWKFTGNAFKNCKKVFNGINKNLYEYHDEYRKNVREEYKINNNYFLLGNVGRLAYPKNQDFLIRLLNECLKFNNKFMLMLVGSGIDKNKLINLINELNLNNNVIFVDHTDEVYKFYSAFDTFLMPSFYEGLGITAVEAQFAKIPVLLSKFVDKEVLISNATTFLDLDIKLWAKFILDFKNNQEKYNKENIVVNFNKFDRNFTFEIIKNIYLN